MPEGVGYGPQNTASVGKEIHVIGNHAYAYSGSITNASGSTADKLTLSFTSGNYYLVGHVSVQSDQGGTGNEYFDMKLNGISVILATWDNSATSNAILDLPLPIIIPPFTEVQVLVGGSGTDTWTTQIVGRIYGKIV